MLLISRQFVSRASGWEPSDTYNHDIIINNHESIYLSTTGYHCAPLPLRVVPRKFVACSSPLSVVPQVHVYLGT